MLTHGCDTVILFTKVVVTYNTTMSICLQKPINYCNNHKEDTTSHINYFCNRKKLLKV